MFASDVRTAAKMITQRGASQKRELGKETRAKERTDDKIRVTTTRGTDRVSRKWHPVGRSVALFLWLDHDVIQDGISSPLRASRPSMVLSQPNQPAVWFYVDASRAVSNCTQGVRDRAHFEPRILRPIFLPPRKYRDIRAIGDAELFKKGFGEYKWSNHVSSVDPASIKFLRSYIRAVKMGELGAISDDWRCR